MGRLLWTVLLAGCLGNDPAGEPPDPCLENPCPDPFVISTPNEWCEFSADVGNGCWYCVEDWPPEWCLCLAVQYGDRQDVEVVCEVPED